MANEPEQYQIQLIPRPDRDVHVLRDGQGNRLEWHDLEDDRVGDRGELYVRDHYPVYSNTEQARALIERAESLIRSAGLRERLLSGVVVELEPGAIGALIPQEFRGDNFRLPGFDPRSIPEPTPNR